MMVLIVGLILFLGVHLLPTSPELRAGLQERMGTNVYKAVFSLLSLAGFIIIVLGYHKLQLHPGKNPILWNSAGVDTALRGRADATGNGIARCGVDTFENSNDYSSPDAVRDQDLGAGASHRERRSWRCSAVRVVSRVCRL